MYFDADLHDDARSITVRRAMLADSLSDLADCRPVISLTVAQTLVADHGSETAERIAQGILDEVGRASERQARNALAAEAAYTGDQPKDVTPAVLWLIGASLLVLVVMGTLLVRHASAEAIEQRNLYRALGDAAPAYRALH